jgi:hypothetical protein
MTHLFRYIVLLAIVVASRIAAPAQMIYTTEAGFYGGGSYFTGDANKAVMTGMQQDLGLTFRYVFNQRIALHADYHQTKVAGSFASHFPGLYPETMQIDYPLSFVDVTMAFNFFDYGYLEHVMYSSNITPYLFTGIGGVLYPQATNERWGFTLPFGMGMKVRLSPRIHLNVQWTHRLFAGSDRIEGRDEMDNPLQLNGRNWLNNDNAGSLSVGISIGLTQRNCKCQNYQ